MKEPTLIEKIHAIERAAGSQAKAAAWAKVQPNSWWRWSAGRVRPNRALIDMLYDQHVTSRGTTIKDNGEAA